MKILKNDIVNRAVRTFFQGFLGALSVSIVSADLTDKEVLKSLLIGAIAGGLSATMNFIILKLEGDKK